MSYMKTGRANCWATREFEQEAKTGHLCFIDWLDFEEEFRKDFMPLDSESTALNVLETTAYFQGKWTVDNYLNQFRDLIMIPDTLTRKLSWSSSAEALTVGSRRPSRE